MTKHIILIGFKSVGKSAIGKELAKEIGKNFVDLDDEVQKAYALANSENLNCRQIMLKIGQEKFRQLEREVLEKVLQSSGQSVISLGGGTPTLEYNRKLISPHAVIQITAPKNIVYERIMVNGRPAFFSPDEHPLDSFNRIWEERSKIYDGLTKIKIENAGSLDDSVKAIKLLLDRI